MGGADRARAPVTPHDAGPVREAQGRGRSLGPERRTLVDTSVVDCVERVVADRPDWAARTLGHSADLWLGSPPEETPELHLD